ncbi:ABC transporter permease [Bdellovibrionota bacterium FG-1]
MKAFVWRRAFAIAKKEVYHISRDPFTLGAALGLPVFMVIMFGVAIEFNVKNIPLAVSDADHSQTSRRFLDTFASSKYFIVQPSSSPTDAIRALTSERARAALMIPPDFEKNVFAGRSAEVQILLDGSDSSTVGPVLGYIGNIQALASYRIAGFNPPSSYELRTRFVFNPELNSRWFVIPGLNVVVMGILSVLLTSLTIAREYENGSMELLLSTPVQPIEIIIGKLTPYGMLGLTTVAFIFLIARYVFGVPFVGNMAVFALGAVLFLIAYLGQGLLISVVTRKQQVAMQLAMMTGMLPTQLLSGFVFPIESMPKAMQYLTMVLPARWFMQISRETFLQGTPFLALWGPFLGLICFGVFVIALGTRKFKRDLEP